MATFPPSKTRRINTVSIHATLAGGDNKSYIIATSTRGFLSTPPSRVATQLHYFTATFYKFLSTPPSRVATPPHRTSGPTTQRFYPRHPRGWRRTTAARPGTRTAVSIHATLAGGDLRNDPLWQQHGSFYPRHPRGWRLGSVRAPGVCTGVSIHATLAGGDPIFMSPTIQTTEFLSTPPSRVATNNPAILIPQTKFLSTPPSRVATTRLLQNLSEFQFLSTPPSRVATTPFTIFLKLDLLFLSTPPSRVATFSYTVYSAAKGVSIHATLAGGDGTPGTGCAGISSVSIHATLAGGDAYHATGGGTAASFYPRHPRGWRRQDAQTLDGVPGFYPRHPRGWRRLVDDFCQPIYEVSIHATLAGGDLFHFV